MKALVIGATGNVGSLVVRELLDRKVGVRALTRSGDKAKGLPGGVEPAIGDIGEPATLGSVFTGVDVAFMVIPVSKTEAHDGLMGVNGARAAKVSSFVYVSVHHVDRGPLLPHFASKFAIEGALRASGIPFSILRPNNFYQNDLFFQDAIVQLGVYPQPIGDIGVSRVDVRDIAELAAIALTTSGHEGKTYDMVGPQAWSGPSTAEAWSRALGRKVVYGGNDLDAWEKASLRWLPGWMVYDFKLMYREFQQSGLLGTPADIERLTKLLGHPPRSFADFTTEVAKTWSASADLR